MPGWIGSGPHCPTATSSVEPDFIVRVMANDCQYNRRIVRRSFLRSWSNDVKLAVAPSYANSKIRSADSDRDSLHGLLEEFRSHAASIRLDCQRHRLNRLRHEAWTQLLLLIKDRKVELRETKIDLDLECIVAAFPIERLFRNIFENSIAACHDPVRIYITREAQTIDGTPPIQV